MEEHTHTKKHVHLFNVDALECPVTLSRFSHNTLNLIFGQHMPTLSYVINFRMTTVAAAQTTNPLPQ